MIPNLLLCIRPRATPQSWIRFHGFSKNKDVLQMDFVSLTIPNQNRRKCLRSKGEAWLSNAKEGIGMEQTPFFLAEAPNVILNFSAPGLAYIPALCGCNISGSCFSHFEDVFCLMFTQRTDAVMSFLRCVSAARFPGEGSFSDFLTENRVLAVKLDLKTFLRCIIADSPPHVNGGREGRNSDI